jgi:hypothetical protein
MAKSFSHPIILSTIKLVRSYHWWLVGAMLAAMFGLGIGSMAGNSAIMDEIAHIPAGYSYVHFGDYRLNPEHPPLLKDLAGVPLQFMHLIFPTSIAAWAEEVNGQWETGWYFLYHVGNNADAILFWARLPLLLLAVGFGFYLYRLVESRWGKAVGLLTVFFYAFSPNILGHAGLVTTDVGSSIFTFIALWVFVRFMQAPTKRNIVLFSLAMAAAQVSKFNGFLLYPFLGLLALIMVGVSHEKLPVWARGYKYIGRYLVACVLSILWIWAFYVPHTMNMSNGLQDRLITESLTGDGIKAVAPYLTSMNDIPGFKPLVQYLLGVAMVFNRVAGGNVTYFNGQVSNESYHLFFPELFLVKTQVAFLLLGLVAVAVSATAFTRRSVRGFWHKLAASWRDQPLEWTLGGFALFYFMVAVGGNLNLGIRHIMPVYLPIFVLVAIGTARLARRLHITKWANVSFAVLAALMLWYGGSTALAYPSYISYFNELIGGGANAGKYFSDSSVDWGQDLRRLKAYTDAHPEINHLALDYFGGGDPKYYFCDRKYDAQGNLIADASGYDCSHGILQEWHADQGTYTGQYIAVSETFLENDRYYAQINHREGYQYLRDREPVAKIGNSIYVYKLY